MLPVAMLILHLGDGAFPFGVSEHGSSQGDILQKEGTAWYCICTFGLCFPIPELRDACIDTIGAHGAESQQRCLTRAQNFWHMIRCGVQDEEDLKEVSLLCQSQIATSQPGASARRTPQMCKPELGCDP
eukprot:4121-Pelagomonas_calceolata.AAC.2